MKLLLLVSEPSVPRIGQPPKSLQTVRLRIVFCHSKLEQGLSAGDRRTRYSRKSGHGRPDEGLAWRRDRWAKHRDVPITLGRVATLND